ncbi:hypothetical protein F383_34211 [Gossypium arboreum]|uniref:Uncharacterized protein n=1 Tax=Gossypium arboreum TaxID=29729 RepID=A0A0B0N419_GOSAR|nr:hypothetical protein F383_34211 [Gossypium arboreum]
MKASITSSKGYSHS